MRPVMVVGATGFEPATTRPPDVYSTKLSYAPIRKKCGYSTNHAAGVVRPECYFARSEGVGNTGLEPVTSALSKQRSKPPELITLVPYGQVFQHQLELFF